MSRPEFRGEVVCFICRDSIWGPGEKRIRNPDFPESLLHIPFFETGLPKNLIRSFGLTDSSRFLGE